MTNAPGVRRDRSVEAARPAWEVDAVTFRYTPGIAAALDDVSITIPAGRCTAVLGPNGSGKSTLLSLLLGGARPTQGTVHFLGRPLEAWRPAELARRIGAMPQEEPIGFPLTVRALVAMGRYPHLGPWQRPGTEDVACVDAALDRCALRALAERPVGTVSGGERGRARLARALAQVSIRSDAPPAATVASGVALALDEPTAALDLAHEMAFFALLRELTAAGITVLLVTHQLNLAARYADHLVLLDHGRVAAAGQPAEVLRAPVISRVYGWPVAVVPHPGPGPDRGAPQMVPLHPPGRGGG